MYSKEVQDAGFALVAEQKKVTAEQAKAIAVSESHDTYLKELVEKTKAEIRWLRIDEARKSEISDEDIIARINKNTEAEKKANIVSKDTIIPGGIDG
jgi:hypothetical protein